jgi:hypothetical protein
MKIRKDRYEHREVLKEDANRHNNRMAQHPQVGRQIDEEAFQREELQDEDHDYEIWLSGGSVRVCYYQ